jgi:hemin uptake protein HemP
MSEKSNTPLPKASGAPGVDESGERTVDSRDILAGENEVVIRHEGRVYRLRRTRLGKLILTA